jgi:Bacterial protein of unknown function (DUF899)
VAGYVSEGPGLSAYALSSGTVYRTYVTTARGLEPAMAHYGLLDRTPMGRHEEGEEAAGSSRPCPVMPGGREEPDDRTRGAAGAAPLMPYAVPSR